MGDIRINIAGLSQLINQISVLPREVQEEIDAEIIDSVFRINAKQRRNAPKDQGGLVRGIGFERKQGATFSRFEIFSNSEHTGYVEFGTKYRVRVRPELTAIANQMRGPGISTRLTAKQAIYAWAKRKGIEKRAWYAIFMAIMATGIRPQPFFFDPFFEESPILLQRIQNIVDSHSSKKSKGPVVIRPGDFIRRNTTVTI